MLKKGDIVDLTIEKLIYGGEGLARHENMAVFVADTVSGDKVKAEIVSVKKNYAKAVLKEVINPSEHRVKPFCPYANACGGCQWQHVDYEEQLRAKKNIVQEALQLEVNDTIRSPEIKEYRCKVQLPVQQTKVSKRFLAGYYRKGSHDIVNAKFCPVQPSIIDEITAFLREKAQEFCLNENGFKIEENSNCLKQMKSLKTESQINSQPIVKLTAYNEKRKKGLIRHFVYRYSKTNSNLVLTIVINAEKTPEKILELCKEVKQKFSSIIGVAVNFNTSNTNVILGRENALIEGENFIREELDGKKFRISQDAFFQVNPGAAKEMFLKVRELVKERTSSPEILDVYSGSGGFSIFLSDIAKEITAVEDSDSSIADGEDNLVQNDIKNITFINENADTALPRMQEEGKKFEVTILDPPRKGCSKEVLQATAELTEKFLIYVSCNPATLARDMRTLSEKFSIKLIQPVDMFCHTYHVETILLAERI